MSQSTQDTGSNSNYAATYLVPSTASSEKLHVLKHSYM